MKIILRSLTLKLVLAFLLVSLTGAALAAFFAGQATNQEFNRYLVDQLQTNFTTLVTNYYQTNGTWNQVDDYLRANATLPNGPNGQGPESHPGGGVRGGPGQPGQQGQAGQNPGMFVLTDANGTVIYSAGPFRSGDLLSSTQLSGSTAIDVNNTLVGRVVTLIRAPAMDPREQLYIDRTNQALLFSTLGAAVIALLLGLVLARAIGRPLRELTTAIRSMSRGNLRQKVAVRSHDELGELTLAFNQMSDDVERATALRRQMTADIAHELRTPLTVISGYLESLRDGILPPTQERLDTLYEESQHLARLVEDLRTLSLADAGELSLHRQATAPRDLLDRLAQVYHPQAVQQGVQIGIEVEHDLPEIEIDPDRMQQVLSNLVSNALRYTPSGGRITLLARRESPIHLQLIVQDSGAGIAAEDLPRVFERFYRGDHSRQEEGASGLGLAIARSIVELHGGTISVASAGAGQGSTFTIELPVEKGTKETVHE
jgi:two-component system, OmpR family, sensor histidine kinase BaeS